MKVVPVIKNDANKHVKNFVATVDVVWVSSTLHVVNS